MPETMSTASSLVGFVLILMIMSIIGAWIGVLLRFAFQQPVLPPNTPRLVPWGPGSVVLTVVVFFAIQFAVLYGYVRVSGPRPGARRWDSARILVNREDDPLRLPQCRGPGPDPAHPDDHIRRATEGSRDRPARVGPAGRPRSRRLSAPWPPSSSAR